MQAIDFILNILVFAATFVLLVSFARKNARWAPERLKKAFRFFTCQSNVLCAAVCLLAAVFGASGTMPEWDLDASIQSMIKTLGILKKQIASVNDADSFSVPCAQRRKRLGQKASRHTP